MIDKNEWMEDKKFLQEQFDKDGLQTPETLSAESMMQRLEPAAGPSGSAGKTPLRKRRWFRPVISVAACAVSSVSASVVFSISG